MDPVEARNAEPQSVRHFDSDDYSITEIFHEYTKLNRVSIRDMKRRVGEILQSPQIRSMMTRSWKTYRGHARIPLPAPSLGSMTLEDALRTRRSLTAFRPPFLSGGSMTLDQLASVLGLSYGVTSVFKIPGLDAEQSFRAATSAGGLFPLEIYPLVFKVDGLEEGIYHYRVIDHCLELVRPGPCLSDFLNVSSYGDMCEKASVILVMTMMFRRNLSKYLFRGYRFIMNDVGAVTQNLYLTGTALKLGTCALGGFMDDELGTLLGIDNVEEAVALCFVLGPVE